jgi:4'-phosphopantetheinyl transferase EntD
VDKHVQSQWLALWKNILPSGVQISCGPIDSYFNALAEVELASLGDVDMLRTQEFLAGRFHARLALSELGILNTAIPKCQRSGRPIWPEGIVGSITHSSTAAVSHVAAAVAKSSDLTYLGIDAELDTSIHPSIWKQFLTEIEINNLLKIPVEHRSDQVKAIWCIKESAIKATGALGMLDIYVESNANTDQSYEVIIVKMQEKPQLQARAISSMGLTLAVVYAK